MAMTKQGDVIVGGSHRWVRAGNERSDRRSVRATIRRRQNCRAII
jgi:hypothetical protein